MRRAALVCLSFLALAFASGCQKPASERLLGKWRGIKAEGIVADVQGVANESAKGIEFEFKKDVVISKPAKDKDPISARYFVLREDRRSVLVVSEKDGARHEETFTLDTDDTMRWQVLQGKTITFERVKEAEKTSSKK